MKKPLIRRIRSRGTCDISTVSGMMKTDWYHIMTHDDITYYLTYCYDPRDGKPYWRLTEATTGCAAVSVLDIDGPDELRTVRAVINALVAKLPAYDVVNAALAKASQEKRHDRSFDIETVL